MMTMSNGRADDDDGDDGDRAMADASTQRSKHLLIVTLPGRPDTATAMKAMIRYGLCKVRLKTALTLMQESSVFLGRGTINSRRTTLGWARTE